MKKTIRLLLAACLLFALAACGGKTAEPEIKTWDRAGYFSDENENMLSVTWMEDVTDPGWYVGIAIGDLMTGWTLPQEGNTLRGDLNAWDESAEPLIVTVSEEGEDGLALTMESGEVYHFRPMDMPEATIIVHINTEGLGNIAHAEGETEPEIDPEYPFQSAQINLAEPETYSILAWPQAGSRFVKWTKDGEDFSAEPRITVVLKESADYVAVFEEDPDWQNPVMNFIGNYECGDLRARVECMGYEDAWITIRRDDGSQTATEWDITGRLDTDTLTIEYFGSMKAAVTLDEVGEEESRDMEYGDGSGTITFREDGSFLWHDDQSETGEDLVFVWAFEPEKSE